MKTRKYRKLKSRKPNSRKHNKMSKHRRKRYSNRKTRRKSYNGGVSQIDRIKQQFQKKSLKKQKKYLDEIQQDIKSYEKQQTRLVTLYSILNPLYINIMDSAHAAADADADADAAADADADAVTDAAADADADADDDELG